MWFRQLVRDFFELLFNAAGLTIDTLRTFFLVVLSILGPLSFALSVYDGFQSTLAHWISRYISVYLWLPIADLFSAVLAKIQALMLESDIAALQDPSYIPEEGRESTSYFSSSASSDISRYRPWPNGSSNRAVQAVRWAASTRPVRSVPASRAVSQAIRSDGYRILQDTAQRRLRKAEIWP